MDPNKMANWANGSQGGPEPKQAQPPEPDADSDAEHAEEEDESGAGDHGVLLADLEKHIEAVIAAAEEVDTTGEEELAEEDLQILRDGLAALPEDLQACLADNATGISYAEAMEVADHLHEESLIEDPDRVAGWLYQIGAIA